MTALALATDHGTPVGSRKVATDRGSHSSILTRQWISRPADQRFLNLKDLYQSVHNRAERSTEVRVASKQVAFNAPEVPTSIEQTHDLWIELPTGEQIAPTHHSFQQLCALAGAPASYLRRKPSQLVADLLTDDLRYRREVAEVKFYNGELQALAVTGPDYGRIYDHEVVSAVMNVAGDGTGRWKVPGVLDWRTMKYDPDHPVTNETTTLYASDRDVWIMLVDDRNPIEIGKLPDGNPDLVSRGFIVTNSEMGTSALKVMAFYFRAVCANRIIWGVENFQTVQMVHSKYAPARFLEEIRPALGSYAEGSTKLLLDGIEKAKAAKVASDADDALAFLQARNFSKKRSQEILEIHEREEGGPARSAWDMAQGITALARSIPNNDERVAIEMQAQAILQKVA